MSSLDALACGGVHCRSKLNIKDGHRRGAGVGVRAGRMILDKGDSCNVHHIGRQDTNSHLESDRPVNRKGIPIQYTGRADKQKAQKGLTGPTG